MAGDAGTASDPAGGSPSLKMVAPADFRRREGAPGADCEEAGGRSARVRARARGRRRGGSSLGQGGALAGVAAPRAAMGCSGLAVAAGTRRNRGGQRHEVALFFYGACSGEATRGVGGARSSGRLAVAGNEGMGVMQIGHRARQGGGEKDAGHGAGWLGMESKGKNGDAW
uniref:Uncharacterized protein n=1 Tax=Triticum urartu TaxID=4572 RepID=A0A8R7R397_TRIUA